MLGLKLIHVSKGALHVSNIYLYDFEPHYSMHACMHADRQAGRQAGHIDGLVQDRSISSVVAMEILQYDTKPSI